MEYTPMLKTMEQTQELWLAMDKGWRSMVRHNLVNSKQQSKIDQIAILASGNVNVHLNVILKVQSNVELQIHIIYWAKPQSFQRV